jgi:UV DNA damage endonuclease
MSKFSLNLGLCCINTQLRKDGIFCSRTMIRKNFTVEKAQELALKNIKDIETMCEWNYKNKIYNLRLSSDIFPHFTDDETEPYTLDFAIPALQKAGEVAKKYEQRITMHPAQFNQVGAKDDKVFQKTCRELKMHADILDYMGISEDGILCVHGGGVYGDKEKTIQRWIDQFKLLPDNVQRRLAIENCERCYSVVDCLRISKGCNIPLIFDTHHFDCYKLLDKKKTIMELEELLPEIIDSWKRRNITPIFHISEQRPDARVGAHSDYIETIPEYLLKLPEKYKTNITLEVEAKMKELAIQKLYTKYPELVIKPINEVSVKLTPYEAFCEKERKNVQRHNPNKPDKTIDNILSKEWAALTENERDKFIY